MSYSSFSQSYKSPMTVLGENIGNAGKSTSGMFERFRNNKYISGSSEFLNSNTLIAKVSFLLLVIIGFVLILNLSSKLIGLMLIPNKNPILINGMHDGEIALTISQNPNVNDAVPIYRSVDEDEGLEFTWCSWLFIKNLDTNANNAGSVKHIFNKGSDMGNNISLQNIGGGNNNLMNGMAKPNNSPGLYLDSNTNKLRVVLNTYNSIIETVTVDNIPMRKWFLISIRVKHKTLDVYINNNVAARHVFETVPKQNYGDVYVSQNGGFNGKISNLRYFDKALSGIEIDDIVRNGPNLNSAGTGGLSIFPPYLSMRWFFGQN
jgi:hypothetical protein